MAPKPNQQNEPTAADPAIVAARQERAAGRILDDEGLRADLTDDEYQPLLNWALDAVDAVALTTVGLGDDEADQRLDAGVSAIRDIVRIAGAAVAARAVDTSARDAGWADAIMARTVGWLGDDDAAGAMARKRLAQLARRLERGEERESVALAEQIAQALSPLAGRVAGQADGGAA